MIKEISKNHFVFSFQAMASPCEIHVKMKSKKLAKKLFDIALNETSKLEQKYSRYKKNNFWHKIHQTTSFKIDEETFKILNFAKTAYQLSDGLFDISSGILREVWKAGIEDIDKKKLKELVENIGFEKIYFDKNQINIPKGMEIDFGGIVKEYAVDKTASLILQKTNAPFLINYGGDLYSNRCGEEAWIVGLEDVGNLNEAKKNIHLQKGAIATSGNTRRFFVVDNKKYGHILNPKTGYPIEGAPLSISVYGESCVEAGFVATMAILQGSKAESFLKENDYKYWIQK